MEDFKKLRVDKGITQIALAEKANISLRQLVRIENRECRPNLETRILLYKALEISDEIIIDYIIENYIKTDCNEIK